MVADESLQVLNDNLKKFTMILKGHCTGGFQINIVGYMAGQLLFEDRKF